MVGRTNFWTSFFDSKVHILMQYSIAFTEEKEMKLNPVSITKKNAKGDLVGGACICAAHNVGRYICHALNI